MSEEELVKLDEALSQFDKLKKGTSKEHLRFMRDLAKQVYKRKFCLCSWSAIKGVVSFWKTKRKEWSI